MNIENNLGNWEEGAEKKIRLKNDKYRAARGGEAHLLEISCARCNKQIILYQKDGKGGLLRCYLNRIMYPFLLENLQYNFNSKNIKSLPNLKCYVCSNIIGIPMIYEDGRVAYRLRKGFYSKRRLF